MICLTTYINCICRFYSSGTHFHRMLHLLANEVMLKAKDIVGEDILEEPEMVNPAFLWHHYMVQNYHMCRRVCP